VIVFLLLLVLVMLSVLYQHSGCTLLETREISSCGKYRETHVEKWRGCVSRDSFIHPAEINTPVRGAEDTVDSEVRRYHRQTNSYL
jgi:hypothetical protein